MRKYIFKTTTITISLITLLITTSCNTNSNNTDKEDVSNSNISDTHIETTFTNSDGEVFVNIDADVISNNTTALPVATIKRHDIESSDIETMATSLFDNGEFHNIQFIKEDIYGAYAIEYFHTEDLQTSDALFSHDPMLSDIYTDVDIESCYLAGTYNTLPCKMLFQKYDETFCNATNLTISIDASGQLAWGNYTLDQLDYSVLSDNSSSFNDISIQTNNKCSYSIDDAVRLCNDMVNTLGITDMAASRYCDLLTTAYTSPVSDDLTNNTVIEASNCGYRIYYEKSINNVNAFSPISPCDNSFRPWFTSKDGIAQYEYNYECLIFTVLDCGIVTMEYGNPVDIIDITSDSAPLLDFDSLINIADLAFNTIYGNDATYTTTNSRINISSIRLDFMRVAVDNEEDSYTLIPVWNFIENNSSRITLTLNAIDGNIVHIPSDSIIVY